MNKILIIEDDIDIANIQKDYLEINNFQVIIKTNGVDGLNEALTNDVNLILLDVMLPELDGFSICKQVREKKDIPIIMVSALQEDNDKIRGLGLGADDYIEKPFSPSVLVAKIKANLSQYNRLKNTPEVDILEIGDIKINTKTRHVYSYSNEIELKNKEYELLLFLMRNPDIVYSKEALYEKIWGMDALGDNATVAVHINRLRDKIEQNPSTPIYIQTIRGAGYRFKRV